MACHLVATGLLGRLARVVEMLHAIAARMRRGIGNLLAMALGRRGRVQPTFVEPTTARLSRAERIDLAPKLLEELFLQTRERLTKWADITGQSAQVDSGYIAQHLVSLVTGIPGVRRRGKGLDLADDSEVKTANSVDGIDMPRWNVSFVREDTMDAMLEHPYIFFVLFDHTADGRFRARIWGIEPRTDEGFGAAFATWRAGQRLSTNFQLHPPIGRDDDIATNDSGNLRLPKMFEAVETRQGHLTVSLLSERPTGESTLVSTGRWDRRAGLAQELEEVSEQVMEQTEGTPEL